MKVLVAEKRGTYFKGNLLIDYNQSEITKLFLMQMSLNVVHVQCNSMSF